MIDARWWIVTSLLLGACASTSSSDTPSLRRQHVDWAELWPEIVDPATESLPGEVFPARRPDAAQAKQLRAAEEAYRSGDDAAFAVIRDRIAADQIAAFWLARMLSTYSVELVRGAPRDPAARARAGAPWERPLGHLRAMGAAAAPEVIVDLMISNETDQRKIGEEALIGMGAAAQPALQKVLGVDDAKARRTAMYVVANWHDVPGQQPMLEQGTHDSDLGVRANAWRGYARGGVGQGGAEQAAALRTALGLEPDEFVRRAIVETMGHHRDRATAEALVDFLAKSIQSAEADSARVAREALERLSGRNDVAGLTGWRRWLEGYEGENGT